jgi:zinc protease
VSRLYRTLAVERAIATDAGSSYNPDSLDPTAFVVWASPLPGGDLGRLEREIDAVVKDMVEKGVSEAEVEQAKRQLQDRAVLARDDLQAAPRLIAAALMTGLDVAEFEAWPERIGSVTAAEVNEAARALFRPEISVTTELRPKPTS